MAFLLKVRMADKKVTERIIRGKKGEFLKKRKAEGKDDVNVSYLISRQFKYGKPISEITERMLWKSYSNKANLGCLLTKVNFLVGVKLKTLD